MGESCAIFIIKNDSSTAAPQSEKTDGFCEHNRVIDEPAVKIAMRDQVLAIATSEYACESDRDAYVAAVVKITENK